MGQRAVATPGEAVSRNPWTITANYKVILPYVPRPGRGVEEFFRKKKAVIMPGTYSQKILLHIIFSTKHREPWITT